MNIEHRYVGYIYIYTIDIQHEISQLLFDYSNSTCNMSKALASSRRGTFFLIRSFRVKHSHPGFTQVPWSVVFNQLNRSWPSNYNTFWKVGRGPKKKDEHMNSGPLPFHPTFAKHCVLCMKPVRYHIFAGVGFATRKPSKLWCSFQSVAAVPWVKEIQLSPASLRGLQTSHCLVHIVHVGGHDLGSNEGYWSYKAAQLSLFRTAFTTETAAPWKFHSLTSHHWLHNVLPYVPMQIAIWRYYSYASSYKSYVYMHCAALHCMAWHDMKWHSITMHYIPYDSLDQDFVLKKTWWRLGIPHDFCKKSRSSSYR